MTYGMGHVSYIKNTGVLDYNEANGTYACPYCLKVLSLEKSSVDHVIPQSIFKKYVCRSSNYMNDFRNRIRCCMHCNRKKDNILCMPLMENSRLKNLPIDWQIQYAKYFYKCFMSYRYKDGYPLYFGSSTASRELWKAFLERLENFREVGDKL